MKKIGVLSLQGSVAEHLAALSTLRGVKPVEVNSSAGIKSVDGLIIPGGESTTISRLLKIFEMEAPLKRRIEKGMPVWGTCAGMILLAKEVLGENSHLALMDISVRRNAYGRQLGSFRTTLPIPELSTHPIECVFIRAPWVERVWGDTCVLAEENGHIIAARQRNMLVTSFHPELTDDTSIHSAFVAMC